MKLKRLTMKQRYGGKDESPLGWTHCCPACDSEHDFAVDQPFKTNGARWTFDGNLDSPTFSPSMVVKVGPRPTVPEGRPDAGRIDICHYFLRAGQIQYLGDCTHAFAGKTVPLPDFTEEKP